MLSRFHVIPFNAVLECDPRASENIERASNSKVDSAIAEVLDMIQVLQMSSTTGICDRYTAPLRQFLNKLFIYSFLEALIVGCMDQEFGAIWFKRF